MSSPLYDFSIVPFTRSMKNLHHCMGKAEAYAKEQGDNVDDYLHLKIYDDMKPFSYQIQRVSDNAKSLLVRIGDVDASTLSMEDNETTFAQLKGRLMRTIEALDTHGKPSDFEGKENKEIEMWGGKIKFTATTYLQMYGMPNFYFHVTTAYDLLRMKGVPVGKMDFMAPEGIEALSKM